jgi:2-polyprenyl-3-methyl-5-hydroxy-6-metoxy-1,4-benzoquinol methylase
MLPETQLTGELAEAPTAGGVYREYDYRSGAAQHSNAYLEGPVTAMLRMTEPSERLLDAGCGNGSLSSLFRRYARNVYAFDLSESGVAIARQVLGADRARVASVYEDFTRLFADAPQFDVIVSCEVIEHLYDPRAFVRRAHEALEPGGHLVLSTPYHGYVKNLALALTGKLDAHFSALWDGGHIKFWSPRTLTSLLVEQGFVDIAFRGAGRLPGLWKSMVLMGRKPR